MATHLPSNLYAGEAERFNMMPHVQFSTQLLAQRKAKDEAIDNYYRNLPNTINDKGVRDIDIPVISAAKNAIQDYWMKNKDAIRKGNTPEAFNLQKMYRDAHYATRESQNAAQTSLELGKLKFQNGKEYIFDSPAIIKQQALHDLPVGNPRRKSIDLATITIPPKPFDVGDKLKNYADIKYDEGTPEIQKHPTDKYYNIEITPKKLSTQSKNAIYERAATDYENDPSFKNHIDNVIAKTPQQRQALSDVFTSTFGHPIENEHDIAAAYMLSVLPKGEIRQKLVDNGLRAKEEWNRRNSISFAQSLQKIRANKQQGLPTEDLGYISDNVAEDNGEEQSVNGENKVVIFTDNVDPERLNIITGTDKDGLPLVEPVKIYDKNTKRDRYAYYQDQNTGDWLGKGGQRISREAAKDRYVNKMSPSAFKSKMGTKAVEKRGTQGAHPAATKTPVFNMK